MLFGKKDDIIKNLYSKYGFDKKIEERIESLVSRKVLASGTYTGNI